MSTSANLPGVVAAVKDPAIDIAARTLSSLFEGYSSQTIRAALRAVA